MYYTAFPCCPMHMRYKLYNFRSAHAEFYKFGMYILYYAAPVGGAKYRTAAKYEAKRCEIRQLI